MLFLFIFKHIVHLFSHANWPPNKKMLQAVDSKRRFYVAFSIQINRYII